MSDQAPTGPTPLPFRAKVLQIQQWIRQSLGESKLITLEWDRTGGQLFELLGGDRTRWTTLAIFGRLGEFRMSAPQSPLMFEEPSLRYTVDGDDLVLDTHCRMKGLASRISPADSAQVSAASAAQMPVGIAGIGGLMTVISLLSFVWQLIHPSISLTLPGSIGCQTTLKGDVLSIDFLRPLPALKIHVVATFSPSLSRIVATPDKLRFEFEGSVIREREMALV